MGNILIISSVFLCYVVAILNRREAIKLLTIPHQLLRGCDISRSKYNTADCTTLKLYTPTKVTDKFQSLARSLGN